MGDGCQPPIVTLGGQHLWTLTHPSTCGNEAWCCVRCGVVVERPWGLPSWATTSWQRPDGSLMERQAVKGKGMVTVFPPCG